MDGRRFRRWFLCGGLVVAAAGGCQRNTYQNSATMPKPGDGVATKLPGSGLFDKKPVWGGGPPPAQSNPVAGVPGDPTITAKPRKPGQGFQPDTLVSFGDTWTEQAFKDPPPPSKDQLIDQARVAYQKAIQKDPKNKGAILGMARLYARAGDKERAAEAYKKYVDMYPKDAEVMHEVAVNQARDKNWAGAVGWCEAALRADPENRQYRKTLGFCQARAGKWDAALASLCQVMPEAQARHNLAGMLDHLGQRDASRQQLQFAIQADPSYAPAREFLAELDQPAQPAAGVPGEAPNPIQQVGGTAP